ncbi:MAG: nucleotidyltransferase domain-containing protein [Phycisphaeraceae bacterium]|nr:nucleotidyltransferase domain-containing protein [Phycisphaeraceae bacterium]
MTTSRPQHRQALDRILDLIRQQHPACRILLTGSVLRGQEHAGSDLDLFAVTPDLRDFEVGIGEVVFVNNHVKVVQTRMEGVPVTITSCDMGLLDSMTHQPWRNYLFAKAKILTDPQGVIRNAQQRIERWFKNNPAVEELWLQQAQKHAQCKAALREGRNATLAFPSWDAFADHVDALVKHQGID